MRCDRARTAYLAGEANHEEMDHLEACSACAAERSALDDTRAALDDDATWTPPSPQLEERIVALISGMPEASRVAAGPSRRRLWTAGIGVAAALAAALAFVLLTGSSPDWEVPISGTDRAPAAAGVIQGWNEPDGTRLLLEVEGLPEAPAGSVYELWLSRDDIHVSAGTFRSAGSPELWVGVSRAAFPRLWVTLEPIDADESPSGETVLDTRD